MRTVEIDAKRGSRIKSLRLDKGFSRKKVAELAGISPKFLYEIENRNIGFSAVTLQGLSYALGVSSDYILYGKSNIQYEEDIAETIGKFDQATLVKVDKLLKIVYELTYRK